MILAQSLAQDYVLLLVLSLLLLYEFSCIVLILMLVCPLKLLCFPLFTCWWSYWCLVSQHWPRWRTSLGLAILSRLGLAHQLLSATRSIPGPVAAQRECLITCWMSLLSVELRAEKWNLSWNTSYRYWMVTDSTLTNLLEEDLKGAHPVTPQWTLVSGFLMVVLYFVYLLPTIRPLLFPLSQEVHMWPFFPHHVVTSL